MRLTVVQNSAYVPTADDSALTPTGELSCPLPTISVVNSLLRRAFRERRTDMTRVKMQKMLFFLNGWHLAITGSPCIDRAFDVWKYGPVVPSVYYGLKQFRGGPITGYLMDYDPLSESFKSYVVPESQHQFYEILDLTWEKYIGIDAARLSTMSHAPDSPWATAVKNGSRIIRNDIIRAYFIGLARPARPTRNP
jgi:uncharacterized phage-associated protein